MKKLPITEEAIAAGQARYQLEQRVARAFDARGLAPPDMDTMSDEELQALLATLSRGSGAKD